MKNSKKTKRTVLLSMFIGIEVVLMSIPFLGFIPIGPIKATTLHIPVIILSILLGWKEGAILGGVFGCLSVLSATFQPTITSFCFSPFYSVGGVSGNFYSLLIAFVPRVCIGIVSASIYQALKSKNETVAIACAGLGGAMINTILVLGGIALFFAEEYALALGMKIEALFGFIQITVLTNGVAEAILGALIAVACCKALKKSMKGVL